MTPFSTRVRAQVDPEAVTVIAGLFSPTGVQQHETG